MAIQFRCPACRRKLSIARRKAGALVHCPACSEEIRVPEDVSSGELAVPIETLEAIAEARRQEEEADSDETDGTNTPAIVEKEDDDEGFQLSSRPLDESDLDMTPMVDVTFLLLIFFMITASFSSQKSLETNAPEPDQEGFSQMPQMDDLAEESVIVEIDDNNSIFVDDESVGGLGELQDVLLRKMSGEQKREMIIEAHYQAKHGTVVGVHDVGVEVGMQRIRRVSKHEQ